MVSVAVAVGALAGCGAGGVELGQVEAADAYVVAVRDSDAYVVAVDVDAKALVVTARLDADGQDLIHTGMIGLSDDAAVMTVVRRSASTDVVRVTDRGAVLAPLATGLDTGLAASDGVNLVRLDPVEDAEGAVLRVSGPSGESAVAAGVVPERMALSEDGLVVAGAKGDQLYVQVRDASLREVGRAEVRAPRPIAARASGTPIVVVAGESASIHASKGDLSVPGDLVEIVPSSPTATVADVAGSWLAYDVTANGVQSVLVSDRAGSAEYRVVVPPGEPLLGVRVTRTGAVVLMQPTQAVFSAPGATAEVVKLVGETGTLWP